MVKKKSWKYVRPTYMRGEEAAPGEGGTNVGSPEKSAIEEEEEEEKTVLDIDSSHLIQYACQEQCGILMLLLFFS